MSIKTGRVVSVVSNGQRTNALDGPLLDEADTWLITIQSYEKQTPNVPTVAFIRYWQGEASFQLPAVSVGQAITRLLVTASKVQVDLLPAVGDNVSKTAWACGLVRGGTLMGPESGGAWVGSGTAAGNNFYNVTAPDPPAATLPLVSAGATKVYAATSTIVNFNANTTLYVLLFDQTTQPGNGTLPIPGGRSSALTPGNPTTDFGGEFTPLVANAGLWAMVSTTPDVLTLAAGTTFTFDAFLGVQ